MNQENMMAVLGSLELQGLQEIVAKIAATSTITIMKPARTALVMMGVKDSVQMVPFYLGEVLISQCAVTVDETIGFGFMMGEDLEKAYCLAVIEAALVGKHQLSQEISEILAEQASAIHQQQQIEHSLVAKTKVRFETMEETPMNPAIDYDAQLVMYTQKVFRSILDSMARPGKINFIDPFPLHFAATEIGFAPYILGIASTLLDIEVGFHVTDSNLEKLNTDLAFHTNSHAVSINDADYIFMTSFDDPSKLQDVKRGNLDYPDSSATIIMVVDDLAENKPTENNSGMTLNLKGPGILGEKVLFIAGIPESFLPIIQELNSEFPLGIDLILVNQERIACLPRSITIEMKRDE